MGDLVSMRRAKKRLKKDEAAKTAEANRAKFGRTKSQREQDASLARKSAATLEQHKLLKGEAP